MFSVFDVDDDVNGGGWCLSDVGCTKLLVAVNTATPIKVATLPMLGKGW